MAFASNVTSFAEYFPLRNPTEEDFKGLCQSLWDWRDCSGCGNRGNCSMVTCKWTQQPSLLPYCSFYRVATYRYTADDWFKSLPLLRNHQELHQLVQFIVDRPSISRECLIASYFNQDQHAQTTEIDKSRAVNLAYSIITMLPCAETNSFHLHCPESAPVTWKKGRAACLVWETTFPRGRGLTREEVRQVTTKLSANRLRECGIEIIDTTDPRLHLTITSAAEDKGIYVFHQAGFLKQHLAYRNRHHPANE